MRRTLIALMAGMMLAATMPATATRHYAGKPAVAATAKSANDAASKYKAKQDTAMAVVAYSDTTDAAADEDFDDNDSTDIADIRQWQKDMRGMMNEALMPIAVVFIMFFMAPVVIIGLIVYLIVKSRNQKLRLAELAIQNGQPIPEFIKKKEEEEAPGTKGIKCMFIGIGLFIALLLMGLKSISGFGLLVMFIGCGQFVIANWTRWTSKKDKGNSTDESHDAQDGSNVEDGETRP